MVLSVEVFEFAAVDHDVDDDRHADDGGNEVDGDDACGCREDAEQCAEKRRGDVEKSSRAMCGTTSPMNPMGPQKAVATAVSVPEISNIKERVRATR